MGFGVIEKRGGQLVYLKSGLLKIPSVKKGRLAALEASFLNLLKEIRPDRVGIEKLFFVKNQKTALEVGQSRGILINILEKQNIPYVEIGPAELKLAVTGYGRAGKEAVARMVANFLNLEKQKIKKPDVLIFDDVTDALAIAIAASNKTIDY